MLDLNGGISIIEMLRQTNIIILVGGGNFPAFPKKSVIIWDDSNRKIVSELKIKNEVKNVLLKVDR